VLNFGEIKKMRPTQPGDTNVVPQSQWAIFRWEDDGGAMAAAQTMRLPLFFGRAAASPAVRLLRAAAHASRLRLDRFAWLVGLGLLVLVLWDISGILLAGRP
jgi:hypothetical protein